MIHQKTHGYIFRYFQLYCLQNSDFNEMDCPDLVAAFENANATPTMVKILNFD